MNLYQKIITIYPNLTTAEFVDGTITLQNDGNGDYIKSWTNSNPQPTQAQLDALENFEYAPPKKVSSVTMRQARLALLGAGLLDTVNTNISLLSQADQITWEFASSVERDWPLINSLATVLNLTSDQIDNLFATAATL